MFLLVMGGRAYIIASDIYRFFPQRMDGESNTALAQVFPAPACLRAKRFNSRRDEDDMYSGSYHLIL